MAAPPPKIVIPPAKPKTPKGPPSSGAALQSLVTYAPGWQPYIALVKNAAKRWGADPAELLALLTFENTSADPNAKSGAGAIGLAQIADKAVDKGLNPGEYQTFVQTYGAEIPPEKASDPAFAINYAAWRLAGTRQKYGSLNDWYTHNYNPNFSGDSRGAGPEAMFRVAKVPGYQPTIPQSPAQSAGASVDTSVAKADLTTRWAVMRNGKVVFKLGGATAPNGVLKDPVDGTPLTDNRFLTIYSSISDTWQAFTGKRPNYAQAAGVIAHRWSDYQFKAWLGARPDFIGSPVWKQNAPGYADVWHTIYGPDAKPDQKALRYAIINNLGSSGFADTLRQRPDYMTSNEFKQSEASLSSVFQQIYGTPSPGDESTIQQAALHGYDANTFAAYLRKQPEYTGSTEYASKALSLLDALGLITGQQAVLRPGTPAPQQGQAPTIGTDKRAPAADVLSGLGLVPGLSG